MSEFTVVTHIPADPERAFLLATNIGLHQRSMSGTGERAVSGRTSGNITLGVNRPDFRSVLQARMEDDEQEVFAGDA